MAMAVAMAVGRLRGDAAVLEQVIRAKGRLPVDPVVSRPGAA